MVSIMQVISLDSYFKVLSCGSSLCFNFQHVEWQIGGPHLCEIWEFKCTTQS